MVIDLLSVVAGLSLLVLGGEALVRGASGIALIARVMPTVVGLTIVAAGTSMPELVVSMQAASRGSPGLAVGNVVGSNIFNIGAIVGLAAMIRPLRIQGSTVRLEWPIMMLSAFQLHLLGRDGHIDRLEGGFLLGAMAGFTAYAVLLGHRTASAVEQAEFSNLSTASFGRSGRAALPPNLLAVAVGAGLLAAGSSLLVHGAVAIAGSLGVSETTIGLTIVAAGTSTPELVTSLVAARRAQDDIAVANVIGSNIFNVLGIVGSTALVHPLPVPREIIERDNWWMLAASLVLFPLIVTGMRVSRAEGALLFAAFATYLTLLIQAS